MAKQVRRKTCMIIYVLFAIDIGYFTAFATSENDVWVTFLLSETTPPAI